jgi:RNA polymerase sigma-70 factor (ECF subfamily)
VATFSVSTTQVVPAHETTSTESMPNLVARAQEGDGDAFGSLYSLHNRRVYSLCLLMTGDTSKAEDLAQDAFIQVFRKLNTFRGDSTLSTWLYRITVNTVLMSVRRRKFEQVSYDEPMRANGESLSRDFGCHDPELSGAVDRVVLKRAIEALPEGCRTIFVLHEVLHCSVGNSKSQLHKARMKLRELLLSHPMSIKPRALSEAGKDRETVQSKTSPLRPVFVGLVT